MKISPLLAGLIAFTPVTALAIGPGRAATPDAYTCVGPALSRVALRADDGGCCDGHMRCAQLLSTQGMIRTPGFNRT